MLESFGPLLGPPVRPPYCAGTLQAQTTFHRRGATCCNLSDPLILRCHILARHARASRPKRLLGRPPPHQPGGSTVASALLGPSAFTTD